MKPVPTKPKLIIVRGPSGAGKSTASRELLKRSSRPTLLVSEDYIRLMFSDHHRTGHGVSKELTITAVSHGLRNGYDVIYEGILNVKTDPQLEAFLKDRSEENYLFYLDVSFDETLKRHQTRPQKSDFGSEAMKRWWNYASPMGNTAETLIPESSSLEETVAAINRIAGLGLMDPT